MKHFTDWLFRDRNGKIVIWQWPNIPLYVWLVSMILANVTKTGAAHRGFSALSDAALVTWSYLEITSGDSKFRRILGGIVLAYEIFGFFS